ncbi:hypothetical protein B0T19DRAFT_19303 [Cercophora scortea]|uniref:Chromo domain-containing protein n=1 Tax=Cercophora scortea TaxID=314031 RepID=A0AAE0J2P7_9PEZI|nr:hypothetical protein B0T19DRAFT_19303 [Cercophora scortea]
MDSKKRPPRLKTKIEVHLPSFRKYARGSVPPPPLPTLVPPRDSTAYIIDQFVLPSIHNTNDSSRRLIYYHIAFTDLPPAAKFLIPCDKVLDYVSPREFEEWEYKNMERMEQERAREAEKLRQHVSHQNASGKIPGRVGRPPKIRPVAETTAAVSLSVATDESYALAKRSTGPSLSTPQKRKLALSLEEEEEEDEEDTGDTDSNQDSDDAAIQRQLFAEVKDSDDDDNAFDSESVDQLAFNRDASVTEPSRGTSLVPPLQLPLQPHQGVPSPRSYHLDSRSSVPVVSIPPPPRNAVPSPTPYHPEPRLAASTIAVPLSGPTSTPARVHPAWARQLQSGTVSPIGPHSQSGNTQPSASSSNAKLAKPHLISQDNTPQARVSSWVALSSTSKAHSSSRTLTPQSSTSVAAHDSTLAFGSALAQPNSSSRKQQSRSKEPKEKQLKPPKKPKLEDQNEVAEDEWVVKELLDERWINENGKKVHKFLVHWEGDWPVGQNPTWEPVENIRDEGLIKKFRKKKKAGLVKMPDKFQPSMLSYMSQTQYSNVAEAFEGDINDQAKDTAASAGVDSDEEYGEELLVAEDVLDFMGKGKPLKPVFKTFDDKLAAYQQTFHS